MKRLITALVLSLFVVSLLSAATPVPNTTFNLVQGLPDSMSLGETDTVLILVTSDQEFTSALALPSFEYPGKGVVAVRGGDRAGRGTSAMLELTFQAKSSTARMAGGVAPVHVVVGVRYPGGYAATRDYVFEVAVP